MKFYSRRKDINSPFSFRYPMTDFYWKELLSKFAAFSTGLRHTAPVERSAMPSPPLEGVLLIRLDQGVVRLPGLDFPKVGRRRSHDLFHFVVPSTSLQLCHRDTEEAARNARPATRQSTPLRRSPPTTTSSTRRVSSVPSARRFSPWATTQRFLECITASLTSRSCSSRRATMMRVSVVSSTRRSGLSRLLPPPHRVPCSVRPSTTVLWRMCARVLARHRLCLIDRDRQACCVRGEMVGSGVRFRSSFHSYDS